MKNIKSVDLFCGVGGLTHGFVLEGLPVVAGLDLDPACRYPYEVNNGAKFLLRDISKIDAYELGQLFEGAERKVLAGCAPCQPFSTYAQRYESDGREGKWGLMYHFARLAEDIYPDVFIMENVPAVIKHEVFHDFVKSLEYGGYHVWYDVVDSARYGVPQMRRRMVLLASRHAPLRMIKPSHPVPKTVKQVIGKLPPIQAGGRDESDPLHTASSLSVKNLFRIKYSKPGGTWRDWPEMLIADCHKAGTGKTYQGVYGRMEWNKRKRVMNPVLAQ